MISPIPHSTETLVVAIPWDEIKTRLLIATGQLIQVGNTRSDYPQFTGQILDDRFRISLKITRPNSFLPTVIGRAETTPGGCLLFLKYKLFPTTRTYLIFWTMFSLFTGIFLLAWQKTPYNGLISISISIVILLVSRANFKIQLKFTRDALHELLA